MLDLRRVNTVNGGHRRWHLHEEESIRPTHHQWSWDESRRLTGLGSHFHFAQLERLIMIVANCDQN